jgi:hypothetical protein
MRWLLPIALLSAFVLAGCDSSSPSITSTSTSTNTSSTPTTPMVVISGSVEKICPGAAQRSCYSSTTLVGAGKIYIVSGRFTLSVAPGVYQTTLYTCRSTQPIKISHAEQRLKLYGYCTHALPKTPYGSVSSQTTPTTGPAPIVAGHGGTPAPPVHSRH